MQTTQQIADRLAELCRQGNYEQAQNELYNEDVESIEQHEMQGFPKQVKGMEAVREKGKIWESMVEEIHSTDVSEPVIAGNHIAMRIDLDMTMKGMGRSKSEELAVYEVKDGKVIREEFFYTPTGQPA